MYSDVNALKCLTSAFITESYSSVFTYTSVNVEICMMLELSKTLELKMSESRRQVCTHQCLEEQKYQIVHKRVNVLKNLHYVWIIKLLISFYTVNTFGNFNAHVKHICFR